MTISAKHLRHFERRLRRLRAALVHRSMQHDREAYEISQSREDQRDDLAACASLEAFALGIVGRDLHALNEIDDALDRIETGEYGMCLLCGHDINRSRLEALAHAQHCISCANWLADQPRTNDRAG